MKQHTRALTATSIAAIAALTLVACGGSAGDNTGDGGAIDYWLWDANQLPAYKQCATDFSEDNPDTPVKVTQIAWDDYWSKITNGMVSGTAPDVFTNHLAKYPDFLTTGQLLELDTSSIDMDQYAEGLADVWVGQDGAQYGLPKDWDTVALFYNKAMIAEAGISEEEMANLTWNPEDGGTYEEVIAHLSVDKNGTRGDEAGFDKGNVAVYGHGLAGSGAGMGQAEWSFLTGSTGWTHTDENPWGTHYNYDDPRFQDTIQWWAGLIQKGYMPPLETTVGASMADNFGAGKSAINANGSWMIGQYIGYDDIDLAIAPTPVGPADSRVSMFNGLADSIWAATKNPDGAKKWVEYLASTACQDVVAEQAVVFPAIQSSSDKAAEAFAAKGVDVSPFTQHVVDGTTFLFPITEKAAKIEGIMKPAMDAILTGDAEIESLDSANEQVDALFE